MKTPNPRFLFLALAALIITTITSAADIAGTWKWSLPSSEPAPVEVTLIIQPGEGTYSATYAETGKAPVPVTVSLNGDSVSLTVEGSSLGKVQYIGRHEEDVIDGLITVLDRVDQTAEGISWRATRSLVETQVPAPAPTP